MTVHVAAKPQPQADIVPHSFLSWLSSQTSLLIGHLLGLVSFAALITSLFYYSLDTGDRLAKFVTPLLLQKAVFYAHVPFILFCIVYLLIILDVNDVDAKRVVETHKRIFDEQLERSTIVLRKSQRLLKEFKVYFLLFWISMLALYLAFLFIGFLKEKERDLQRQATIPSQIVSAKLSESPRPDNAPTNEKGTAADVQVQLSERVISVVPASGPPTLLYKELGAFQTASWEEAFAHVFPEFLPFALNSVSLMFIFWCLSILYVPYQTRTGRLQQRRLIYFSGLVVFLLITSFPLLFSVARDNGQFLDRSLLEYVTVFNAVSGTLNAVVVALLIARLDSKLIGLPSWLVSMLYLYAGVQPLFVVFSQPGLVNEVIKTVVLLAVFVLKIYFFLIILYAMQTGRMLNYMFCFPSLNRRVSSMFDNRFQITMQKKGATSFDFVISKGRSTVYETDLTFGSRQACMEEIEVLRQLMSERSSYHIDSSTDGVIVEIRKRKKQVDKKEAVCCTSVDQGSKEKAEALITASMNYVPYCKLRKLSQ